MGAHGMKMLAGIFVLFFSVLLVNAQNRVEYKNYGFSIEELPVAQSEKDSLSQTVIMFLPSDGKPFMPNVNVQIQAFGGTPKEYMELSKSQFDSINAEIIKNEEKKSEVTFEYKMSSEIGDMHFYAKAHFAQEKVYLITATALESQWEKSGAPLKKNVDSFRLLKNKK
jgi:hypothetical protein